MELLGLWVRAFIHNRFRGRDYRRQLSFSVKSDSKAFFHLIE
jgi:hypothetical protein